MSDITVLYHAFLFLFPDFSLSIYFSFWNKSELIFLSGVYYHKKKLPEMGVVVHDYTLGW